MSRLMASGQLTRSLNFSKIIYPNQTTATCGKEKKAVSLAAAKCS